MKKILVFLPLILLILNKGFNQPKPPVMKSLVFKSTLYENTEDWPTAIIFGMDCYHLYFAGFIECSANSGTGCPNGYRNPVMGKVDPMTGVIIWEKEYLIPNTQGPIYGSFAAIYEEDGGIWGFGVFNGKAIITKVHPENGEPFSGYPRIISGNETGRFFGVHPVYQNGIFDGFIAAGPFNDKARITRLKSDGTLDTNFGNGGYYELTSSSTVRNVISVDNIQGIGYAFIGTIHQNNDDVIVQAISPDGKNVIWTKIISESLLGSSYTDIGAPEQYLCSGFGSSAENDKEWGWGIVQNGNNFYISAMFDYTQINNNFGIDACTMAFEDSQQYLDADVVVLTLDAVNNGNVINSLNVSHTQAADFSPDLELRDGFLYVLGGKSNYSNNGLTTDELITKLDLDLNIKWEKQLRISGNRNCGFSLAFDCDGMLYSAGNNDLNDDDYVFYKIADDCQLNTSFDIVNNMDISSNIPPWSLNKKINATIRVKSGGVLTINSGATIEFGSSWNLIDFNILSANSTATRVPRIIVENGGQLILDNCTLRGLSSCSNNSMWDGVEVQNGGIVNLSNGAIIMDAKYGILADKGSYNSNGSFNPTESNGGGIIQSNGATIANCRRGIHFANCASNTSSITSTTFSCTGYLKDPGYKSLIKDISNPTEVIVKLGTSVFVSANDASGMNFSQCTWINSAYLPPNLRGIGIASVNSHYQLNGGSSMTGLNIGIQADATNPTKFIYVSGNNQFTGNQTGILLRGGNLHKIVGNNTFVPKFSLFSPIPFYRGAGVAIYNSGSNKILIEDNTFTAGGTTVSNSGTYGIISENSGSVASLHKHNHFTNVQYGDQTQKNNGGLNLWCNDHTQNRKAWFINPQTSGTFPDQGNCGAFFVFTPHNNFFDPACQTSLNHIQSSVTFNYWEYSNEPHIPNCNSTGVHPTTCNGLNIFSGCDASIVLTPGNAGSHFSEVPYMSEGTERELLVNDLIRYYILNEKIDTVLMLLANESNENYKMAYALLLLDQGNFSQAQNTVEALSTSSEETESFTDFFNILVYAKQNELKLSELPNGQVSALVDIAENRTFGGYSAQVILANYYNREYPSILETEDSIEYRSKKEVISKVQKVVNIVNLIPNPVSDFITINYELMDNPPFNFKVTSVEGKQYLQKSISDKTGQLTFDIESLPNGVYFIYLSDHEKNLVVKRFVKY